VPVPGVDCAAELPVTPVTVNWVFFAVARRYASCATEYYEATADGQLIGCMENSVVCSQLKTIIPNGKQLCERFDMAVGSAPCYSGQRTCFR
jgi:hypothetical protein